MKEVFVAISLAVIAAIAVPGFAHSATVMGNPSLVVLRNVAASATLKGLPIFSSDGEEVGQVVSDEKGSDGSTESIRAEISGFLGLGTGMVTIDSGDFVAKPDRIVLIQTADEVRGLPGASYESFDGAGSGSPPPGPH